jgi:predicted nucleic acid-binding protein
MISFDAAVLSIAIDPKARVPVDFRTGKPIPFARERVDAVIASLEQEGEVVLIAAPALAEALTTVAPKAIEITERLESVTSFRIRPFGKKEAIEIALRTHSALKAGDKREGVDEPWQKVKYDRQIIAIAKTEGATAIYSTDKGVHEHARLWGVTPLHLGDIPVPAVTGEQEEMFEPRSAESAERTITGEDGSTGDI